MRIATLSVALLALTASCANSPNHINDHWSASSIGARIGRSFLGYDANLHGDSYKEFQWQKKQSINLTVQRHFLNHNPDNPFQSESDVTRRPRPNHSPLPNPLPYIHLEGLALGALLLAPAGGAFIPIPIDSILGTIEDEEGIDEFWNGIAETATPLGVVTLSVLDNTIGTEGPIFTNTHSRKGAAALVTPLGAD